MEPAGGSGTVTISDQRSYIRIQTLRAKNPTEIHDALSDICGEFTMDRSVVSRWANSFRGGCVSIDNDPRQEGREHQKVKEVRSLWQMLMKKIIVQYVENFPGPRKQELRRKMHKNRPQLLMAGNSLSTTNTRPHIADVVIKSFAIMGRSVNSGALQSRHASTIHTYSQS